jgi:alanine dehydrogenase
VEECFTFSRLKNTFEKLQEMLNSNVTPISNKTINAGGSMPLITTDRSLVLGNRY